MEKVMTGCFAAVLFVIFSSFAVIAVSLAAIVVQDAWAKLRGR